jgi:hypothetical protein
VMPVTALLETGGPLVLFVLLSVAPQYHKNAT